MRNYALHGEEPVTVQQAFEFLTLADRALTAIYPVPAALFDDIPMPGQNVYDVEEEL